MKLVKKAVAFILVCVLSMVSVEIAYAKESVSTRASDYIVSCAVFGAKTSGGLQASFQLMTGGSYTITATVTLYQAVNGTWEWCAFSDDPDMFPSNGINLIIGEEIFPSYTTGSYKIVVNCTVKIGGVIKETKEYTGYVY